MYTTTKDIKNEILNNDGVLKVYFLHNKIKIIFTSKNDLLSFLNKYLVMPNNVLKFPCTTNIFSRCLNMLYYIKNNIYYIKDTAEENVLILTKMPEKYLDME